MYLICGTRTNLTAKTAVPHFSLRIPTSGCTLQRGNSSTFSADLRNNPIVGPPALLALKPLNILQTPVKEFRTRRPLQRCCLSSSIDPEHDVWKRCHPVARCFSCYSTYYTGPAVRTGWGSLAKQTLHRCRISALLKASHLREGGGRREVHLLHTYCLLLIICRALCKSCNKRV